jgi:hypothetical protein
VQASEAAGEKMKSSQALVCLFVEASKVVPLDARFAEYLIGDRNAAAIASPTAQFRIKPSGILVAI